MNALTLQSSTVELALSGPAALPPVMGFRQSTLGAPCYGRREIAYDLMLEGSPAAMSDLASRLQRQIDLARRGEEVRLRREIDGLEGPREARLYGGSIRPRSEKDWRGGQILEVKLLLSDHWYGAEVELPLAVEGGAPAAGGQVIHNHHDGGHANFVTLQAADLPGDLPGPLRLELTPEDPSAALGEAFACLDAAGNAQERALLLEGEAAQGATVMTDTQASGGAFARCQVGMYAAPLLTWTLPGAFLAGLDAPIFRPLLRFAAPPADGNAWAWWQVKLGEALLWESPHERLLPGRVLQDLGALPLPRPPGATQPAAVTLNLVGKCENAPYTLDMDFVQFCPLSGWRKYLAVDGLPAGETLVDDGCTGQVWARSAIGEHAGRAVMGAPLALLPGRDQRLYLLHDGAAAAATRVRAWFRPAWI